MFSSAISGERTTPAGTVFETLHRSGSGLHYHRHGASFLTIVMDGAYTEVRDGRPQYCRAGTLLVRTASEEHADHFSARVRCLNVELAPVTQLDDGASRRFSTDAEVRQAARAVARAFYGRGGDGETLERSVDWLSEAVRTALTAPAARLPAWLPAILGAFEWTEPRPLADAARLADVHPTHFSREFRRHLGVTPNQYRRQMRARLASDLMLGSGGSLAAIALHSGFGDQSHFTRAFAQTVGLSPARYRRAFAR